MLESAAWKTNREQLLSFTETTSVPLWGKSSRLTKGVGKCEFIWSSLGAGVVFTPHLPGVQMSAREALEPSEDHPGYQRQCLILFPAVAVMWSPTAPEALLALRLVGSIGLVFIRSAFICLSALFSSLEITLLP